MPDGGLRKRRRTMMALYPDEEERDALEDDSYGLQEPSPELMDMSQSGPAEQYEEDEDEMYMQHAPNDTLIALQLLRSQFPAKARVGSGCSLHAAQSAIQSG